MPTTRTESQIADPIQVVAITAFDDNYIWLLVRGRRAAVVDPGDADPVLRALDRGGLSLDCILVTHHHPDHTGGVAEIAQQTSARVVAPAKPRFGSPDLAVRGGDSVPCLGADFSVIEVPGHTIDHIAYYCAGIGGGALFCGDTMFCCGCGRLFEGSPEQMATSLAKFAALPPSTLVYCGHEYTMANLRFARAVEPGNARLEQRERECSALRERGAPTVPSTIEVELATNPFLRCAEPQVVAAAEGQVKGASLGPVATFAALRKWKDGFR